MNKITLGLILGAVLGAIDGATAWFTPEVRSQIIGIVMGSTVKGIIAGVAAGWFAKKVQNLWAGIAFGLVVGAILAYGIVLANGGKYLFAIMLPGSCVGAICGFATQRYGSLKRSPAAAVGVAAVLLLAGVSLHADPPKSLTAAEAFAKLKALDGKWTSQALPASINYHVTGGGTTIVETLFAGTPHEMVTVYTLDGENLLATHYCAAGNQPSVRYNAAKSSGDTLVFDFVSLRGPKGAGYMHDAELVLKSADAVELLWNGMTGDDKDGAHHRLILARAK